MLYPQLPHNFAIRRVAELQSSRRILLSPEQGKRCFVLLNSTADVGGAFRALTKTELDFGVRSCDPSSIGGLLWRDGRRGDGFVALSLLPGFCKSRKSIYIAAEPRRCDAGRWLFQFFLSLMNGQFLVGVQWRMKCFIFGYSFCFANYIGHCRKVVSFIVKGS